MPYKNKEDRKQYKKQWCLNNPEYHKQWCLDHKKDKKEYDKQRRIEHPEHYKQYNKQYLQTPEGKLANQRHHSKHRQLGFIPLNKPFEGCEAHHISQNFVIFIPKEIHQSLYHSIWTWQGMNKINKLAIEFL